MRRRMATDVYQPRPAMPAPAAPTVGEAVDAYCSRKMQREAWSPATESWSRRELGRFARLGPERSIAEVDAEWLYRFLAQTAHMALASRKTRWAAVMEWLTWCARRGWLAVHPSVGFDDDDLPWRGKRGRARLAAGKAQLRNSAEVRAYIETAHTLPTPTDRVGALMALTCGLRSGELRHLRVGDVDHAAGYIWVRTIPGTTDPDAWTPKTAASVRTVALPQELKVDLELLTRGRPGDALLLVDDDGAMQSYRWLGRLVDRVCAAAKVHGQPVQRVTPHGLRGTYASMAARAGKTPAEIATLLGHADGGQTAQGHYVSVPVHQPALQLVQGGRR